MESFDNDRFYERSSYSNKYDTGCFTYFGTLQELVMAGECKQGWKSSLCVGSVNIHSHSDAIPHSNHDIGPFQLHGVNRLRRFFLCHDEYFLDVRII